VKLVNLNIGIRVDNTQEVVDFLAKTDPDIITIQEVARHLEESVFDEYRSKDGIESAIGKKYPYKFFGPLWIAKDFKKHGKIFKDFGGYIEQGNEILSKIPIVKTSNEFFYKYYSADVLDWERWRFEDHGRAVQRVELDWKGKKLQVFNIHGIWAEDKKGDERTIKQCMYIVRAAKKKDLPTIIAGDLNLAPETKSLKIISKEFVSLIDQYDIKTTQPSAKDGVDFGNNVVDYVFVSKDVKVKDFKVLEEDISDHLPMILEFEI